MQKIKILLALLFTQFPNWMYCQIPSPVDPGNPRGDAGTTYFWDNPQVYILVIIVIVLIMVILWFGRKRRK